MDISRRGNNERTEVYKRNMAGGSREMNMEEFDDADIKWLKEHHFNKKVWYSKPSDEGHIEIYYSASMEKIVCRIGGVIFGTGYTAEGAYCTAMYTYNKIKKSRGKECTSSELNHL